MISKQCIRLFSTTNRLSSHVGSAPVVMPTGVKLELLPKKLNAIEALRMKVNGRRNGKKPVQITQEAKITGPKGEITLPIADFVNVELSEDQSKLKVAVSDRTQKHQKSMWGTTRSLINNGVKGVSEGHLSILKLVGTGYRAVFENKSLVLRLGYCTPNILEIPSFLQVSVPTPNRVIIEGCDLQAVKAFAATIRAIRPPEPYKGKGVFVDNETIKLKQRKIK